MRKKEASLGQEYRTCPLISTDTLVPAGPLTLLVLWGKVFRTAGPDLQGHSLATPEAQRW